MPATNWQVEDTGTISISIYRGIASFDARQCANYSTWSLVIPNGLSSIACLFGGTGMAMHPAATGGTATLTMACDTDCSSLDGGLASLEVSGAARRAASAGGCDGA